MKDEMIVDLNVFGALMKNIIMCDANGTTIVIMNWSASGLRGAHVHQEPTQSEKLKGVINKSTILSFGTGVCDTGLFLATPKEKGSSQQETITSGGTVASEIPSLICINVGTQLKGGLWAKVEVMEKCALNVPKEDIALNALPLFKTNLKIIISSRSNGAPLVSSLCLGSSFRMAPKT